MPGKLREFGRGFRDYLKTPELVYSFTLIILIPALIAVNSIILIDLFTSLVDTQAKDKAAATAQLLKHSLKTADTVSIQEQIDQIAPSTTDVNGEKYFLRLDYLIKKPGEEVFELTASSDKSRIGKAIRPTVDEQNETDDPRSFTQLNLSWAERRDIAVASIEQDTPGYSISVLADDPESQKRQAVVSAFVSTAYIDRLLNESYTRSAIILTLTVIVTLALLFVRSRIYRYTTLFRRLQEVDQMKDEFISIASHELRAPITAIRGYLSLMLEDHDLRAEERERMMRTAEKSSEQLARLISDLLDVSRIEQGRIKLAPIRVDVGEAVAAVVKDFTGLAEEKNLRLEFQPPEQKLSVRADRDKLRQILVNFIDNAIKYSFKGSIAISAAPEGDSVAVFIRDTGIGMSPEERRNLFKKFYRIKKPETENVAGTGLGLWITKSLVELMGGEVFVDSIVGSGTQVKFTVPKA